MIAAVTFDFPLGWQAGLPLALALLAWMVWLRRRRGLGTRRIAVLTALRAAALLTLIFLAARPVWVARETSNPGARPVVLLLDQSESMSLQEREETRYQQALDFARGQLWPALRSAGFTVQALLFAQDAEAADGGKLAAARPDGKRTNLGGAIVQALGDAARPPLALIALTDGAVNENADNSRALTTLVESQAAFIGVGFGSDLGVRTLSLRQVDAPPVVTPKAAFNISAQLEMMNAEEMPPFELLLFRDGQLHAKKSVSGGAGSRSWLENFQVSEDREGVHSYTVQLLPPAVPNLKCVSTMLNTAVRISTEKELRVLYIQGALTWDYKFAGLALRHDPTIKLTGLTRTSRQSVFRQNVESAGELLGGFPTTLEEIAPFRVVVLSNLKPADLTPAQQEVLARFCGELGGGVLMIGGPGTFNASWQGSRLEQLLPVVFASHPGVQGLDRPFRLELTDEALQHPVFALAASPGLPAQAGVREVWAQLPTFSQYGRVDAAKPGAQVWALHPTDEGPKGRRILMAAQQYGAGLSAVLCVQNFWRWRLARDSDPQQFDRFWRQFFRFLSDVGRQDVTIHLAEQELRPQMDVQVVLEKQPSPKTVTETSHRFLVRVEDSRKTLLHEQTLELPPSRPVEFRFRAEEPDLYTVNVLDFQKRPVATRQVEIREVNVEFQTTGRNMETLRQWALVSDGLAARVEDCRDAGELVGQIKAKIEQARETRALRRPVGVNGWMLSLVLGCLGAEWVLRKRWGLA